MAGGGGRWYATPMTSWVTSLGAWRRRVSRGVGGTGGRSPDATPDVSGEGGAHGGGVGLQQEIGRCNGAHAERSGALVSIQRSSTERRYWLSVWTGNAETADCGG